VAVVLTPTGPMTVKDPIPGDLFKSKIDTRQSIDPVKVKKSRDSFKGSRVEKARRLQAALNAAAEARAEASRIATAKATQDKAFADEQKRIETFRQRIKATGAVTRTQVLKDADTGRDVKITTTSGGIGGERVFTTERVGDTGKVTTETKTFEKVKDKSGKKIGVRLTGGLTTTPAKFEDKVVEEKAAQQFEQKSSLDSINNLILTNPVLKRIESPSIIAQDIGNLVRKIPLGIGSLAGKYIDVSRELKESNVQPFFNPILPLAVPVGARITGASKLSKTTPELSLGLEKLDDWTSSFLIASKRTAGKFSSKSLSKLEVTKVGKTTFQTQKGAGVTEIVKGAKQISKDSFSFFGKAQKSAKAVRVIKEGKTLISPIKEGTFFSRIKVLGRGKNPKLTKSFAVGLQKAEGGVTKVIGGNVDTALTNKGLLVTPDKIRLATNKFSFAGIIKKVTDTTPSNIYSNVGKSQQISLGNVQQQASLSVLQAEQVQLAALGKTLPSITDVGSLSVVQIERQRPQQQQQIVDEVPKSKVVSQEVQAETFKIVQPATIPQTVSRSRGSRVAVRQAVIQKPQPISRQIPKQKIGVDQGTLQRIKQQSSSGVGSGFGFTPFPRTKEETTPFRIPRFSNRAISPTQRTPITVSVRRFGKFNPIFQTKDLSRAFAVGRQRVGSTLAATFKVSGATARFKTPKGFRSKKEKDGIIFIEKKGERLSKVGELKEIQFFKRKKKKKK
jgi:hypothetical protein